MKSRIVNFRVKKHSGFRVSSFVACAVLELFGSAEEGLNLEAFGGVVGVCVCVVLPNGLGHV